MVAGVLVSGVSTSVIGFILSLAAGHGLTQALFAYSLVGLAGAVGFILLSATLGVPDRPTEKVPSRRPGDG